jgi:predicted DNA-binding transcriptional regulator AlpA
MTYRLLTEKEASPLVGMSIAWLQRKRWEGGGPPYIKYDHAVRYREADLLAWVDDHANRTSTSEALLIRPTMRGADHG